MNEIKQEEATAPKDTTVEIKPRRKKCIFLNGLFPLLAWLIFAAAYYFNFNAIQRIADVSSAQLLDIFNKYGVYGGLLLGFISMILAYFLLGIKKLFRLSKFDIVNPIILVLVFLPWYFFGNELAKEPRYSDIGRLVLDILVEPIQNASIFMLCLAALWLVLVIVFKLIKKFRPSKHSLKVAALLIVVSFSTTGCVSEIEKVICEFLPDSDHCFQAAGGQGDNPDECSKIKGEKFKDLGSNPPKDKCYLLIAENSGDLNVCKQMKGGMMSYSPEDCYLSVALKFENPAGCKMLSGESRTQCREQLGAKIEAADVIAVDNQIEVIKQALKDGSDVELAKQLKGLEDRRTDLIDVLTKANKTDYEKQSDPINKEILGDYAVGDLDKSSKDKLITLNENLKSKGYQLTKEQLEAFKDYFKYISDPANDIEKMDDTKLVKDRWNEKMGAFTEKFKIWKSGPTESEAKLDQQLRFYERMLERQEAIDKGLSEASQDALRNIGLVGGAIKDKAVDMAKDKIIETIFGEITGKTAGAASTVIGEAVDVVKGEAKSQEFRGLVRAYNLGMQEELAKVGGDVEKAHAAVIDNMQKNPYEYEDKNTFAKYGNIIENKDCDGSNEHCVNKDVFWKAMKKSYKYQNGY